MMEVSVVYEVAEIVCDVCLNYHVAVIETDMIKWFDGSVEVKYLEEVQCPLCEKITKIKR
jgi:hypothetical protein